VCGDAAPVIQVKLFIHWHSLNRIFGQILAILPAFGLSTSYSYSIRLFLFDATESAKGQASSFARRLSERSNTTFQAGYFEDR
jgi:hypothetical protein